ncbi:MAG: porin [Myxococcales bacterium]|nr:porin [Myxococcales bacterium]MDH5565347.1 porin [Myxococcales bacterium]
MKRVSMVLAGAAAALLFVAQPVVASTDVESDLAEMREMVKGLQQKVNAQQEQLAHQGELLEDAQQVVQDQQETAALSGLAKFIESLEVDGGVAGSYFWNFNRPDLQSLEGLGGNQGGTFTGQYYRFHPDHNTFQLDHVWFGIGKPASDESRAGFRFDVLYGQTASSMSDFQGLVAIGYLPPGGVPAAFSGSRRIADLDSPSDVYVHQAYVEYQAPIGSGVNLRFGKFAAITGNESLDNTRNNHITHSFLYNAFQPDDHLGVMLTSMAGPVEVGVGVVNSGMSNITAPDLNSDKAYILTAAFKQDQMGVRGTVIYGADMFMGGFALNPSVNGQKNGLLNMVGTFQASDALSLWANADYAWIQGSATGAWGMGVGGRMAVNDRSGVSLRGEYARDRQDFFGLGDPFNFIGSGADFNPFRDSEVFGVTGTVDYTLVENLVLRGEIRWDQVRQVGTNEFYKGNGSRDVRGQTTAGVQVYYAF